MPSKQEKDAQVYDYLQNYWKLNKFIYLNVKKIKKFLSIGAWDTDPIKILKHAFCYNYYKHHKMRRWCGKWKTKWLYQVSGCFFVCKEEKENLDLIKAQFHLTVRLKISSQYKGWRKKKKNIKREERKRSFYLLPANAPFSIHKIIQ